MIDSFEKASVADIAMAQVLGIDLDEVKEQSLHQMRLEMQKLAFTMRRTSETITQERANELNTRLKEIVLELEEIGDYDQSVDYIIDFDCFVKSNPSYGVFSY